MHACSSIAGPLRRLSRRATPAGQVASPGPGTEPDARCSIVAAGHDGLAGGFEPISLEQLNARAEMLERRDNKYVVHESDFRRAVAQLAQHFDVLEIDGVREFAYETCYFDDPAHTSYFDHHRGRRRRCKVRIRKYVDAGLCYVEVKLKDKRGTTVKKRLRHAVDKYGVLDEEAWAHVRKAYRDLYGREFEQALEPAIEMRYRRTTLVAKEGGERMTVDRGLVFTGASASRSIDEGILIVETKSHNANGIADKVLRALHQHPSQRCSKYCVGLAAVRQVPKYNNFMRPLRQLGVAPGSRAPGRPRFERQAPQAGSLDLAPALR